MFQFLIGISNIHAFANCYIVVSFEFQFLIGISNILFRYAPPFICFCGFNSLQVFLIYNCFIYSSNCAYQFQFLIGISNIWCGQGCNPCPRLCFNSLQVFLILFPFKSFRFHISLFQFLIGISNITPCFGRAQSGIIVSIPYRYF